MLLSTKSHPYTEALDSSKQTLSQIFKDHKGNGHLTASYLYHDEVLKKKDRYRVVLTFTSVSYRHHVDLHSLLPMVFHMLTYKNKQPLNGGCRPMS